MGLNNGKYGHEVEDLSMDISLHNPSNFVIEDHIRMLRRMSIDTIDYQKHQKKNHFVGRRTA